MILQSNILCCHLNLKIPQSHKNIYWLISTLIIDIFVFCVRITHIPIGLRCCSHKKVSLLQHIDREHTALLHREAARREAGRGGLKVGGQTRDEISWPSSCPDRRHSPGQPGQLLQPPSASCTRRTTPPYSVWLYWLLPLLWIEVLTCEAIHRIKFRNIMRIEYVRVRAIIKIQNVVQDGTLKMKRICPVSGFSWEKSVYWATWRV